ncbi:hypothetical protein PQX77_020315 [Marasmius sp. AFHP31]|nr:hypothetical protein PQX77_020315 [Marasmius sp. AFHP31]
MIFFDCVVKNCRGRTPTTINLDELELPHHPGYINSDDVRGALLGVGGLALAAVAFHWSKTGFLSGDGWPHKGYTQKPRTIHALRLRKRLEMSSILLVYPTHNSSRWHAENTDALLRLSQSHPKILVHVTELWLRASELKLGDDVELVGRPMYVVGLLLETLVKSRGESGRILKGAPKNKLEAFFSTTHFDLTGTLLKGITLEASRSSPDFSTLRHHFMYINIIVCRSPSTYGAQGVGADGRFTTDLSYTQEPESSLSAIRSTETIKLR